MAYLQPARLGLQVLAESVSLDWELLYWFVLQREVGLAANGVPWLLHLSKTVRVPLLQVGGDLREEMSRTYTARLPFRIRDEIRLVLLRSSGAEGAMGN